MAIRCIQRNFRVFLKVKDWPWWRLLVRITPLLDVNRTDEQLKVALSDIQILKQKLEKSETERNFLKNENEKLECKVSRMNNILNVQFLISSDWRFNCKKNLSNDSQKSRLVTLNTTPDSLN